MSTEARYHYPTNLTDAQWALIEPLLPEPGSGPGRPGCPVVDRRRVIDGILYMNKAGAVSGGYYRGSSVLGRRCTGISTPGAG